MIEMSLGQPLRGRRVTSEAELKLICLHVCLCVCMNNGLVVLVCYHEGCLGILTVALGE